MATDALLTLMTSTVSTVSANSSAVTLPKATMLKPLFVRVIYSAAQQASGSGVWTFGVAVSYDGGSTWNVDFVAADKAITLTGSAQAGELSIPVQLTRPDLVQSMNASIPAPQIRVQLALTGSPVTPTITWGAEVQQGRL